MNGIFSRTTTLILMIAAAITLGTSCKSQPTEKPQAKDFVKVENGQFIRNGKPYYFVGTNFWYGAILGSQGEAGDRERLVKELDMLKSMGVDNLRVLVGGDGDNGVPLRIEPTLQTAPGVYNEELLDGLDYLLMEMGKRDMTAVLYLNNSWEWSGGYGMYLEWAGAGKSLNNADVGYEAYCEFVSQFVITRSIWSCFLPIPIPPNPGMTAR